MRIKSCFKLPGNAVKLIKLANKQFKLNHSEYKVYKPNNNNKTYEVNCNNLCKVIDK